MITGTIFITKMTGVNLYICNLSPYLQVLINLEKLYVYSDQRDNQNKVSDVSMLCRMISLHENDIFTIIK